MDAQRTREHIQQHADAIVRGDMDAVVADFAAALRPDLPEIAKALPQPVTGADVLRVDLGETESVAMIRYSGASGGRHHPLAMAGRGRATRHRAR